jgi:hypothetical protein
MTDLSKLVKPLLWERGIVDYAKPMPGMKYVACSTTPHGCWAWWLDNAPSSTRTVERDEAHAKAAAQADYTARIIAALDPEALAKIRTDALRRAAELVDDFRRAPATAGLGCDPMIEAILAMIDKEDQA